MRLLIELRDQNNVKMMCTLWGRYAKQVYDYSMSNMSTMIICVIRFCSVKEWKELDQRNTKDVIEQHDSLRSCNLRQEPC